jgi:hypothetical protein
VTDELIPTSSCKIDAAYDTTIDYINLLSSYTYCIGKDISLIIPVEAYTMYSTCTDSDFSY